MSCLKASVVVASVMTLDLSPFIWLVVVCELLKPLFLVVWVVECVPSESGHFLEDCVGVKGDALLCRVIGSVWLL